MADENGNGSSPPPDPPPSIAEGGTVDAWLVYIIDCTEYVRSMRGAGDEDEGSDDDD